MSEFEAVPVIVKCEWNNHRFCWWLRIVTLMKDAGIHEEILLVNEALEVERNAVFEGELSFSNEVFQLYNFVPPNFEVYIPQWIDLYGEEATDWYVVLSNGLLHQH